MIGAAERIELFSEMGKSKVDHWGEMWFSIDG